MSFLSEVSKYLTLHCSSLEGRQRKHSCRHLYQRHPLTFGSSFFTMLSHTFLRRALSCSMDKCFFLMPGGGASWENLAKTLVWWWRRGDSSEESSSSLRLFFFTFFNLAVKEIDSQKVAFLPFHRRQQQNNLITFRKFKVLSSFHLRLAMFIPLSIQAHEYSNRKISLPWKRTLDTHSVYIKEKHRIKAKNLNFFWTQKQESLWSIIGSSNGQN